jgi:hypothetical protein
MTLVMACLNTWMQDIFIQRSRKAFISLVDDDIMNLAKSACDSWNVISLRLKRLNTPMRMVYCRKIFGTWLRQHGVETEFVDLLQCCAPTIIFARHYLRPDFAKEPERIREIIRKLHEEIRKDDGQNLSFLKTKDRKDIPNGKGFQM